MAAVALGIAQLALDAAREGADARGSRLLHGHKQQSAGALKASRRETFKKLQCTR